MRRVAAVLALAGLFAAPAVRAIGLPADFVAENATPGQVFGSPTAIAFSPTGRMFVAEQRGMVWAVSNGVKPAAPLLDLTTEVLHNGARGLLGMAVDPAFATNRYIYLLYAVDPDSDGVDDEDDTWSRLTRYQVSASDSNAVDPASRTVLMGDTWARGWACGADAHAECALRFGRDGSLLIAHGDGAQAVVNDGGGYDPGLFLPGRFDTLEDIGAFRAQYLGSLDGKVLRVNPANGQGYASNPFWDGNPASNRSRVWASGLRNPFRFCVRPGTGAADPALGQPGTLMIGDVGWLDWEELDVARTGGVNFGWPCIDGNVSSAPYQGLSPPRAGCTTFGTASNPSQPTAPVAVWNHFDATLSQPPTTADKGNCIIGGSFYTGLRYPPGFVGAFFFGDYGQNWIKTATFDAGDHLVAISTFATEVEQPVDLVPDPVSGDLFYISISTGQVRHLRYTGPSPNHAPVVKAAISPLVGVKPLDVTFDVASSSDPDGDALTYTWAFADGAAAAGAHVTHTYTLPGEFDVLLTADDGKGGVGRDTVRVISNAGAAYPTTAVLDAFTRADGPLGPAWTGAPAGLAIVNAAVAPASGSPLALWTGPFGADQEAFATLHAPTGTATPELILAAQGDSAGAPRVRVRWEPAATRISVATFAADSGWLERGQLPGITFADGQQLGARAYSNGVISVYKSGALLGSIAVRGWRYAGAPGRIGFGLAGSGVPRLDDFGGGDAIVDPNVPPSVTITSPADSAFYVTGQTLALRGSASDPEDPAASLSWAWSIDLVHNNHVHPAIFSSTSRTPDYVAENHDDGTGVSLRIQLTVTDLGLKHTTRTVMAYPEVDLSPSVPAVRPDTIGTSGPAEYTFRLRNFGRMPAPFSHWRLTAGGTTLAQGDTLVPARDSVTLVVRASAGLSQGTATLGVTADTLGAVRETDETNNVARRPLVVKAGLTRDVLAPLFAAAPAIAPGGVDAWLRWKTDEPSRASARYGMTAALGESLLFTPFALDHDLRLGNLTPSTRYFVRVTARDTAANVTVAPLDSFVTRPGTADAPAPARFALSPAWPNPAPGQVALTLELPESRPVRFAVFDIAGREVWREPEREMSAGRHALIWQPRRPRENPAGLYLVRVKAGDITLVRAVVRMP